MPAPTTTHALARFAESPGGPPHTALDVLGDKWWVVLVAFAVALLAVPVARAIAYKYRIVDKPDNLLKPHGRAVAYLGGMGMLMGLLVAMGAFIAWLPNLEMHWGNLLRSLSGQNAILPLYPSQPWQDVPDSSLLSNPLWRLGSIMLACTIITLVGLWDDLVSLTPRRKVLGQVLAAVILLVGGVSDRMSVIVFEPLLREAVAPYWLVAGSSSVLSIILVVGACNATNLLDGLDGLCGGVTAVIAAGYLALAIWLAMYGWYPHTDMIRLVLCLAMMGAVLGFLPYNLPPASIFMGDAGSMLLGFFVAVMMILFCREGTARWFMGACAVFALPTLDTGLAVIRRAMAGKNIFMGDRSHLYDQLVDRGMSVKKVVGLFYVLAAAAATLGVVISITTRAREAAAIYGILLVVILTIFYLMGMMTPPPKDTLKQTHPGEEEEKAKTKAS